MERWRAILGYEGFYEVSDFGRVRSVDRTIVCKNGAIRRVLGKDVSSNENYKGYVIVDLYKGGKKKSRTIHQLVAIAFLGHIPCGSKVEVDHIDDNKLNNTLSNLQLLKNKEHKQKRKKVTWGKSKYKGVCWHKTNKKWLANFTRNKVVHYVGYFDDEKEASIACDEARRKVISSEKKIGRQSRIE